MIFIKSNSLIIRVAIFITLTHWTVWKGDLVTKGIKGILWNSKCGSDWNCVVGHNWRPTFIWCTLCMLIIIKYLNLGECARICLKNDKMFDIDIRYEIFSQAILSRLLLYRISATGQSPLTKTLFAFDEGPLRIEISDLKQIWILTKTF